MKIAVYGVSKSGKDFFIKDVVDYTKKHSLYIRHVRGSSSLREMSQDVYGKEFDILIEREKNDIRKRFASMISGMSDNVVVDGHCSFMDHLDHSFHNVVTDSDIDAYDYFFYLDTNAAFISERMNNQNHADSFNCEEIELWKTHEIDLLTSLLLEKGKELHVIDYTDAKTLEYFLRVINGEYCSPVIASNMVNTIPDLDKYNSIILVDCDKTLSIEDTTSLALKDRSISADILKQIYNHDRYSNYQAFRAKTYFEEIKLFDDHTLSSIEENLTLNRALIDDLAQRKNTKIIAITAGNSSVWRNVLVSTPINAYVLDANMIMSKYIKYYVLKELQKRGKYVIAIGDSMLDSLMLKHANKSYIIANKGYRENINDFLRRNRNIHQLSYSQYIYPEYPLDDVIGCIKCLDNESTETKRLIDVSKSSSGIEGRELRQAHYRLGLEMGKLIETDYPDAQFAVIILMRSGLPFGQGIADYFDCPELFCMNNNIDNLISEIESNSDLSSRILIICDGVINSGRTVNEVSTALSQYRTLIATNVISSGFKNDFLQPIYATRISTHSFVGAKQRTISKGKGPDTSDRLFNTL